MSFRLRIKVNKSFLQRLCFSSSPAPLIKPVRELKAVIGLEIHAQLNCDTKLFSDAVSGNESIAPCNSRVAFFDMATPGTLPRLNRCSIEQCLRTALLLNSKITNWCRFDRKHYFYPDMPLGYQITQKDYPIAEGGYLDFFVYSPTSAMFSSSFNKKKNVFTKRVHLERLQLEMDSGKVLRYCSDKQKPIELVDLNRAGIALVEIVTAPELTSGEEAACFVEQLRVIFLHNSICVGDMHKGHLRVDANVSISEDGHWGARTEIKNLNSFRFLRNTINNEIKRQRQILLNGGTVTEETRTLDNENLSTVSVRAKGDALDYRFTPELNLPPLKIEQSWIKSAQATICYNFPHLKYINQFDFPPAFALQLLKNENLREFVNECLKKFDAVNTKLFNFEKFYTWLTEFKRICEQNNCSFPPLGKELILLFCDVIILETEKKVTRVLCFDLLKEYIVLANNGSEFKPIFEKICAENLWRISDKFVIVEFLNSVIKKQPELVFKIRKLNVPKLGNKNFNRLRNEIVFASGKRIAVEDAEKALIDWFKT